MHLKEIIHQSVFIGEQKRGVCRAVGISPQTGAVKYLFCEDVNKKDGEFVLSFPSCKRTQEGKFYLAKMRGVYPKRYYKLSLDLPIYHWNGEFVGNLSNAYFENACISLTTDTGKRILFTQIAGIDDAVILKKSMPYPLGQRIPAHCISIFDAKKQAVVTKDVLKRAIAKNSLIKMTLSLPPFCFSND